MPRNGSGQYTAPVNGWNPAINATPATAADWQAVLNDIVAALTQSVSRDGQTPITQNMPMGGNKFTGLSAGSAAGDSLRFEQLFSQGQPQDLASAEVTDIGAALTTVLNVTGTTTITSFGTNYNGPRFLSFAGVLMLTHNATTLILPGADNITTAAGDSCIVVPNGTPANGWRVAAYVRAADAPGVAADNSVSTAKIQNGAVTFAKIQNIASGRVLGRATAGSGDVEELAAIPSGVDVPADRLSGDIAAARITNALNATGAAPIYACRAWVNFDGTGTPAIRASGNVSSVTKSGTGRYRLNFTTALPDVNYSVTVSGDASAGIVATSLAGIVAPTTTVYEFGTYSTSFVLQDCAFVSASVFR